MARCSRTCAATTRPGSRPIRSDVLAGFLRAMGVAPEAVPHDDADRSGLFRSVMDGKRMVLMLDDASDGEQIEPLLPGSADCLVIVTRGCGWPASSSGTAPAGSAWPAWPRRGGRVARRHRRRHRVAAEPDAAAELVQRCANLPLALRIVADRAASRPGRPLADLVAELRWRATGWTRCPSPATTRPPWAACSPGPTGRYPSRRRGCSGCWACFPAWNRACPRRRRCSAPTPARRLLDGLAAVHLVEESGRDGYRLHELVTALRGRTRACRGVRRHHGMPRCAACSPGTCTPPTRPTGCCCRSAAASRWTPATR